ncbi:MAG: hemolysin [Bdellovibrio sp. ArHS]|uniref:PilZ domain-containing protein n=1 Tax=Bdellovibrio sp. ArHS TaxID=1569284 RepID=UPI0005825397|nr:PilZ domain-containing protein [Bdellovibrio sp. ArHS]KHD89769.1 MAG: hemolysin [Bdellovibrio sp. ArHS]
MDKDIFTLVGREEEKLKLWKDLAQAKGELLCKGQEDSICKLRVIFFNTKTNCLECTVESTTKLKSQEEYLGHFFLGGEKYYFQGFAQIHQDKVVVPIADELYHLQRRQNYRVRIPEGYQAFYNIILVNEQPQKIIGQLADLSSQGCRVIYRMDAPLMKLGDKVTGHLVIGKRPPVEIQGLVRHIKVDEGNKVIQTFGIEFTPLATMIENKLFALTMEIHKEVFKRPS